MNPSILYTQITRRFAMYNWSKSFYFCLFEPIIRQDFKLTAQAFIDFLLQFLILHITDLNGGKHISFIHHILRSTKLITAALGQPHISTFNNRLSLNKAVCANLRLSCLMKYNKRTGSNHYSPNKNQYLNFNLSPHCKSLLQKPPSPDKSSLIYRHNLLVICILCH